MVARPIRQGDVYWYDFGQPRGSDPGFRRPAVVVQSDLYNATTIATVVVCAITSSLKLARQPGNLALQAGEGSLPRESVVNVTQIVTIDRRFLEGYIGTLSPERVGAILRGLDLVLHGVHDAISS